METQTPQITEWLSERGAEDRHRVEYLAGLVHAARDGIDEAIKWRRLTFTVGGDWHHWVCAVAVTIRGVNLMFHKGALLPDPERLLLGEGRYLRHVPYAAATAVPHAVTTLVADAIVRQTAMLD